MVLSLTLCNSCASSSFQSYNQCYIRSSKSVMAFLSSTIQAQGKYFSSKFETLPSGQKKLFPKKTLNSINFHTIFSCTQVRIKFSVFFYPIESSNDKKRPRAWTPGRFCEVAFHGKAFPFFFLFSFSSLSFIFSF